MRNILAIIAVYAISLTAHAGWKTDLFVGGSNGQLSYKKGATTYTMTNGGVPAGFFTGYKAGGGFFVGLKYMNLGAGSAYGATPTTHPTVATSHHLGGLGLGFEGAKFRVFVDYYPMDNLYFFRNATTQTNHPDAFYGTSSFGAGFGYRFTGSWGLNLMYASSTYTTFDFGATKGATINSTSTFQNVTDTNYGLLLVYTFGGGK